MTRDINKRLYSILIAILCAFCWLATPAAAESCLTTKTYDGPNIEYLGEPDTQQTRGVTRLKGMGFTVYLADYIDGVMTYYTGDGFTASSSATGYTPYNFTVPQSLINTASTYGLDYIVIELYFSVEGTGSMSLQLTSDDDVVITGTVPQAGYYSVMWNTPIQYSTYNLKVYTGSTSQNLGGHISA